MTAPEGHDQFPAYRSMRDCFNEAGALLPRKETGGGPVDLETEYASMRPGHYCPGRPSDGWSSAEWPTGWRFNEAGALLPRKAAIRILRADFENELQ
ncbi:hypothetical protein SAMN05421720_103159 [Rhodospira trueperi]|uniref:Uncharacterized protein n=1 Tax=Rhodospira trueperi TaxID=69960 RepID=A0A1G7A373_9PROT|nr:hypothetical protein SAMN05421720_103159 [Rhodospira trueperi]